MLYKIIFNELYKFIKARDRWRCFIIRHRVQTVSLEVIRCIMRRCRSITRHTLCIQTYIYIYVYVCMYVCVCVYACMHLCMYVCMYLCVYVCMCVCVYVCMCVCVYVCMYVWVYVYVCTGMCMWEYVCMSLKYIFSYNRFNNQFYNR